MQLLLLFFIDGARYIEETDLYWKIVSLWVIYALSWPLCNKYSKSDTTRRRKVMDPLLITLVDMWRIIRFIITRTEHECASGGLVSHLSFTEGWLNVRTHSQFLILPPFQRQGHGSNVMLLCNKHSLNLFIAGRVYSYLHRLFLSMKQVFDFGGIFLYFRPLSCHK